MRIRTAPVIPFLFKAMESFIFHHFSFTILAVRLNGSVFCICFFSCRSFRRALGARWAAAGAPALPQYAVLNTATGFWSCLVQTLEWLLLG